jgi:hypothetical protein
MLNCAQFKLSVNHVSRPSKRGHRALDAALIILGRADKQPSDNGELAQVAKSRATIDPTHARCLVRYAARLSCVPISCPAIVARDYPLFLTFLQLFPCTLFIVTRDYLRSDNVFIRWHRLGTNGLSESGQHLPIMPFLIVLAWKGPTKSIPVIFRA